MPYYLLMCSLFIDALSSLDCIAFSGRTVSKQSVGKRVEGSVPGQFEAVSRNFLEGIE
jgi:hypothetical protein